MKPFLLRFEGDDEAMHTALKIRAAEEDKTMHELAMELLRAGLETES